MTTLSLHNLSFFYDQRKCDGVDRINFDLKGGELCALLGPSGSGKTSLLKLIAKEITPQKGMLTFSQQLKPTLYLPLDNPQLLPEHNELTLYQYLSKDSHYSEDQLRDQIAFMELSDEFYAPISSLSTGQWHRAQLAKFFLKESDLLLLDEPFIHLDPSRRQYIAESLLRLAKENNKIVIWSTHFLEDALLLSDKILLLQHGVQQQFATPAQIYWEPENLFAAHYFGENNLILASKDKSHHVKTAWGEILLPEDCVIPEKEFILMCRPHVCYFRTESINQDLDKKSNSTWWKMKLEKISFFGAFNRLEFSKEGRKWWVETPSNNAIQSGNLGQEYWIEIPSHAWKILKTY